MHVRHHLLQTPSNKVLHAQKQQSATDWRSPHRRRGGFQGESLHAPLNGPNAGSESVMAVRGADMWAFGRGRKGQWLQRYRGGIKEREGGQPWALPEDSTGSRQTPSHPASWSTRGQYGNSPMRGATELLIFFFSIIILAVFIVKKKKKKETMEEKV